MNVKNFIKSIGFIFLYLFLNVLISLISYFIKTDNLLLENVILVLENIFILLIIYSIMRKKMTNEFNNFKKNYKKNISISIKYWFMGFVFMIITNLIITLLFIKGIAPNEESNREILNMYPLYSIISMCLIGPFIEELLFRLNFSDVFKNRTAYIIVTGIIFGSMHVILSLETVRDLFYIIPYSCLGIAFGAIYYDTKNIYSSIFAHSLHNTLTIAIILFGI